MSSNLTRSSVSTCFHNISHPASPMTVYLCISYVLVYEYYQQGWKDEKWCIICFSVFREFGIDIHEGMHFPFECIHPPLLMAYPCWFSWFGWGKPTAQHPFICSSASCVLNILSKLETLHAELLTVLLLGRQDKDGNPIVRKNIRLNEKWV